MGLNSKKSILRQLAEFTAEIDCDHLPEDIREKIKYCILDALECCLDGNNEDPRTKAVWEYVKERDGNASAFGRGKKLKSSEAAFYNTVTGAVSSRNDISKSGSCHPGSVVVPVVFALAEEYGCSGKQIMDAVLAGYETMIRLGMAIRLSSMPKAFRSTAVLAPFGAAFAAAKIMDLSIGQTVSAASFACHSASGFNNWVSEGTGEDVLQNGWGARNGIEGALLAKTGLKGAQYILEDKDGLLAAFSALEQKDVITKDLGIKWHILDVDFKPMCSCLKLMAPCQIAKKLRVQIPDIKDIAAIKIGVAEKTLHHAGTAQTEVSSQVQAIMSIPFGVANVLVTGDYGRIKWDPPYDPEILKLMKLCTVEEQPQLTKLFPGKRGAELTITLLDGTQLRQMQDDVEGLSVQEVKERFENTMSHFYGKDATMVLIKLLMNTEQQETMFKVFEILQKEGK